MVAHTHTPVPKKTPAPAPALAEPLALAQRPARALPGTHGALPLRVIDSEIPPRIHPGRGRPADRSRQQELGGVVRRRRGGVKVREDAGDGGLSRARGSVAPPIAAAASAAPGGDSDGGGRRRRRRRLRVLRCRAVALRGVFCIGLPAVVVQLVVEIVAAVELWWWWWCRWRCVRGRLPAGAVASTDGENDETC